MVVGISALTRTAIHLPTAVRRVALLAVRTISVERGAR